MKRLLGFLQPYRGQLVLVMALLLAQAIANLYLPALNADIVNSGVAKGDVGYIVRVGGLIVPAMAVFLGVLVSRALPLFAAMQVKVDRINKVMRETLSTIRDAHTILVMNHGRIVEQRSHERLLARQGFYQELYDSQFAAPLDEVV